MDNIKTLYKFNVEIEREVEVIEQVVKDGQPFEMKGKKKQVVPVSFALKRPNRQEFENTREHFGVEYNKAITDGLLTKGMMVNKYANTTGGIFSQSEAKELLQLFQKRDIVDTELKQAVSINAPKETQDELTAKLLAISRQILEIELSNQSLFQYTADNRAKEQTVAYMLYFFSYIEKNGKWTPFFEGDDFTQKRKFHFALEDKDDPLLLLVRDRLINLFAHYYEGVATTEEEFANVEKQLQNQFGKKEVVPAAS